MIDKKLEWQFLKANDWLSCQLVQKIKNVFSMQVFIVLQKEPTNRTNFLKQAK